MIFTIFEPWGIRAVQAEAAVSAPSEADGWVQIFTAEQLVYIDQNQEEYLNRKIRLENDIDLAGHDWIPFGGNEHAVFSGVFDGRGHLISGINVIDDERENVGFFGSTTGVIKNLGVDVHIEGGAYTGGLVGLMSDGSIDRAYVTGSVKGGTNADPAAVTGGLAGGAIGEITRSFSLASVVSGTAPNIYAGGLVGAQGRGGISDSYASGNVSNQTGDNYYLFSSGLVPHIVYGSVQRTYATGYVDKSNLAGAFNSLIAGLVSLADFAGSFVADSFFDIVTTGVTAGSDPSGANARETSEMRQQSTYADAGWDFTKTWAINPAVNNGYPYLRPAILTEDLPNAVKDVPYSVSLAGFDGARGGIAWSAAGLPDGLSLIGTGMHTAVLQGTAEQSGTYSINITVTDAGGATDRATLQLTVKAQAPEIAAFNVNPGDAYQSAKVTAEPQGADHSFAYTLSESADVRPLLGTDLPADAVAYRLGEDIPDVTPGQYLNVYEADSNGLIQAWTSVRLTAADIQARVRVTSVRLDPDRLTLVLGQAPQKLAAVVLPEGAAEPALIWSSNAPEVAEVNENGEVTPVAAGEADITVTTVDGSFTATAKVTVMPPPTTAGTVTGAVYGTGETPLSGVTAAVYGNSATTDSQGNFTLLNIPEGKQTVTFTASGYKTYFLIVNVTAGEITDVGRIAMTSEDTPENPGDPVDPTDPTDPVDPTDPTNPTDPGTPGGSGSSGSHRSRSSAVMDKPQDVPAPVSTMTIEINGKEAKVNVVKETANDGRTITRLILDGALLSAAFASQREVIIAVNGPDPITIADIPVEALRESLLTQPEGILQIHVSGASYGLPLHVMGTISGGSVLSVTIAKQTDAAAGELQVALGEQGYQMLAAPVEFSLTLDGKELADTGAVYTERSIKLNSGVNPAKSTAVWVDANGRAHFVPSVFKVEGDGTEAFIYAPHNSMYTVVQAERTFSDVQGHWAQTDVEMLANKLVLTGGFEGRFTPDGQVTRAEFSAMLVRSLGLREKTGQSAFNDVPAGAWYAGAAEAAFAAGLINGYPDGSFKPNAPITREQMAAMIARAVSFAGELPGTDALSLERFSDHSGIAGWAQEPVKQLLAAGMIEGTHNNAFAPDELATRAQSAVLLKRTLEYLEFIN
ncbi:S-layer homology domain-containing protein [Paenibacillus sp. TH7-28]